MLSAERTICCCWEYNLVLRWNVLSCGYDALQALAQLPENDVTAEYVDAMAAAVQEYGQANAIVLFVVQPGEKNSYDQQVAQACSLAQCTFVPLFADFCLVRANVLHAFGKPFAACLLCGSNAQCPVCVCVCFLRALLSCIALHKTEVCVLGNGWLGPALHHVDVISPAPAQCKSSLAHIQPMLKASSLTYLLAYAKLI